MRGWQHLHKGGTQRAACAFSHANAALAAGPRESLAPGPATPGLGLSTGSCKFTLPGSPFSHCEVLQCRELQVFWGNSKTLVCSILGVCIEHRWGLSPEFCPGDI